MRLQQLDLNTPVKEVRVGHAALKNKPEFFRRQFSREATKGQITFDAIFGIALPVICIAFDPVVFSSEFSLLGVFKPFAFILSYCSIMGLLAFMMFGAKLKWMNAFLAGLFVAGGLISLAIGLLIAPVSFLGLIILIGALGFIPFFTAFVLFRNSIRAYDSASGTVEKKLLGRSVILAGVLSLCIPFAAGGKLVYSQENGRSKNLIAVEFWRDILRSRSISR